MDLRSDRGGRTRSFVRSDGTGLSHLGRRPRIRVLYHYFPPDDAVSAKHFGDLCASLAKCGWDVASRPSNRGCRDESQRFVAREVRDGYELLRVWRPGWREASSLGRLLNALWMIAAWSADAVRSEAGETDVLLVGTDPPLSVLVAWVWKRLRPRVRIAHWAFDLYPEAAIADGLLDETSPFVRIVRRCLGSAYRSVDLLVDIGACMGERIDRYAPRSRRATLVPWALSEPDRVLEPDPSVRRTLFGDARLGLLYSGNFGRAHAYAPLLDLARRLRDAPIHFSFAVRGNRSDELRRAVVADDRNVSFAPFAPQSELASRLAAADVHLASLHEAWQGVAVPSKFFGSLAAGRPVLYAGPRDSAVGRWISKFEVGWILDRDSIHDIAAKLRALVDDAAARRDLQTLCWNVYQANFARSHVTAEWDRELRGIVAERGRVSPISAPATEPDSPTRSSRMPRLP